MRERTRDFPVVAGILADIFYYFGFMLLVPLCVGLLTREWTFACVFGAGTLLFSVGLHYARQRIRTTGLNSRHAAIALALAWALLSMFSCVPFVLGGMSWIDALFEAFSAWTDTGLTMIPHPETLPVSLSVFRIVVQWVSGLGIVMFMLSLRGSSPRAAYSMFQAEGRFEDFSTDIWHVGRTVLLIYAGYTAAGFLLLWALGVPPFHALTHAITSLSTGGFSTNSVGVGVYGALPSIVAMALMLCGGISFSSHQALLSGDVRKFFRNPEVRTLLAVILGATALIVFQQWLLDRQVWEHVLSSAFYVITTITTCGAGTTVPLNAMPDAVVFTIVLLMLSGAVYGSTSGALKLWRLIIVTKLIGREIQRPFYPTGTVLPIKMGNNVIDEGLALQVTVYILLYLGIGLVGTLIFMLFGYRALYALFTVFSAQGNVGLNAMPDGLYYGMPVFLKLQVILHMLIGRMEIYPLLYFLRGVRK